MTDEPTAREQPDLLCEPIAGSTSPPRPWLELLVILLVGVVPHLANALIPVLFDPNGFGGTPSMPFALEGIMHTASSIGTIAVVLWIMRQSGEPWAFFGFLRPRPGKDFAVGVGLYSLDWVFYMMFGTAIAVVLEMLGFDPWADPFETGALARPTHPFDLPMILAMSVANASAEQLVITAYIISRLRSLLRNPVAALAIATALFASYHIYQGSWGVVNAASFGLIFGGFFCITRRIWPCIVAHCFADIVPFVLAYFDG